MSESTPQGSTRPDASKSNTDAEDRPGTALVAEPVWATPIDEVLARLKVLPEGGLEPPEIARRLECHGLNVLTEQESISLLRLGLKQFKSLIMVLLMVAAAVAYWFGDQVGALAILVVIVINVGIAFTTELTAVKAMAALSSLGQVTARVLRSGQSRQVPAEQLVPGDIILIDAGDVCPADCRIVSGNKLQADESSLTGESLPVRKSREAVVVDALLAHRSSMVYRGTSITRGTGSAVVTATGRHTEIGGIATMVAETHEEQTPLEQKLDTLAYKLIWITLGITAAVTLIGTLAGKELALMIETGIALAVAAIPEGLPVVATIALARGMYRMAQKNAVISRLASVETLGATGVICTDKTGTLTENLMTAVRLDLADQAYALDRMAHAELKSGPPQLERDIPSSVAKDALEIAVLCNNAEAVTDLSPVDLSLGDLSPEKADKLAFHGDPLEVALLRVGINFGIRRPALTAVQPEVREEAFDSVSKMMATVHQVDDRYRIAVKGAPEEVISASTSCLKGDGVINLDEQGRQEWLDKNEQMASDGLRVIAVAQKMDTSESGNVYENLTLVGLIGLLDPPREEVRDAILQCRAAGIRVVMMTGDQTATAMHIGRAVSLLDHGDKVIHGSELQSVASMAESEQQKLLAAPAFARVSPQQKLELIDLHQQSGQIVAMTGDGVNDAPALKKADIGVAMGQRGTQVAREAADMVLQDDSFSNVVSAIREGRIIFTNIRMFALYLLSCNVSEVMIVGLAAMFGSALPLLPLQILFLNLVTDVFPALALGVGSGTRGLMSAQPRPSTEPLLGRREWLFIVVHGATITVSVMAAFWLARHQLQLAGNGAVTVSFLTLALTQLWHVLNLRATGSNLFDNQVTRNRFVWLALAVCVLILTVAFFVPGIAYALHLTGIGWQAAILVCVASLIPTFIGQLMIYFELPFAVREAV